MRLFIAIDFDNMTKDSIYQSVQYLKKVALNGNFTTKENLHLTLAFIGDTTKQRIIEEAMNQAIRESKIEKFPIQTTKVGRFRRHEGDIYWLGIEKNDILERLNKSIVSQLRMRGFDIEEREFKAHLTLGRRVTLPNDLINHNIEED